MKLKVSSRFATFDIDKNSSSMELLGDNSSEMSKM